MYTNNQTDYCLTCANHLRNTNDEIICRYSNKAPDFEDTCVFYESNSSTFDEFEKETFLQSAGMGRRFANYILDLIFFYIFFTVIVLIIFIIAEIITGFPINYVENSAFEYFFGIISTTTYYTLMEYITKGRSLGKFITNTKVITLAGEKPNFKTCLIRSLCRLIPFEVFSFFGSTDSGWHDSIAKTRVVMIKK